MNQALIRVTCEALTKALGLEYCSIDMAFMDAQDIASNSISFRVRGAGDRITEGATMRYASIDELNGNDDPQRNTGRTTRLMLKAIHDALENGHAEFVDHAPMDNERAHVHMNEIIHKCRVLGLQGTLAVRRRANTVHVMTR